MMKILFQGDSITDAFRRPEEINPAFQLGNGYVFLIAARLGRDFPGRNFRFLNRGVSGDGLRDLSDRWEEDVLACRPDVLSLLVGVNETIRAMQGKPHLAEADFAAMYRRLLVRVRDRNPEIRFVLMEPFLLDAGRVDASWKAHLAPLQKAVRRLAEDFRAVHLPLQTLFDEALKEAEAGYWVYDGIHPTHAGFQRIADAWLAAVTPVLKTESADL